MRAYTDRAAGVQLVTDPATTLPSGFRITREGLSLFLVTPLDASASRWLHENCEGEWFGPSLVVEHGFIAPLFDGIVDAGFEVQ